MDEAVAELEDKPVDEPVAEHEAKADAVPEEDAAWEEGGDPNTEGSAAALHNEARAARVPDCAGSPVNCRSSKPPSCRSWMPLK